MWPQHGRSHTHMVNRFVRKLKRRQGRRFCGIVRPIAADSHMVDASASVLSAHFTRLAGRQVNVDTSCRFLSSSTLRNSLPFAFSTSPGQLPTNLLLGIPTRPFASMRRAKGLARGTAFASFPQRTPERFPLLLARIVRWCMGNNHCQVDALAINLEDQQTERARFRSDSCSHQHRSVYSGLNTELTSSICATGVSHKMLLLACDVTFDARFLHSYHVASVQAHVSVDLVDSAVCVDSVLVTA